MAGLGYKDTVISEMLKSGKMCTLESVRHRGAGGGQRTTSKGTEGDRRLPSLRPSAHRLVRCSDVRTE